MIRFLLIGIAYQVHRSRFRYRYTDCVQLTYFQPGTIDVRKVSYMSLCGAFFFMPSSVASMRACAWWCSSSRTVLGHTPPPPTTATTHILGINSRDEYIMCMARKLTVLLKLFRKKIYKKIRLLAKSSKLSRIRVDNLAKGYRNALTATVQSKRVYSFVLCTYHTSISTLRQTCGIFFRVLREYRLFL